MIQTNNSLGYKRQSCQEHDIIFCHNILQQQMSYLIKAHDCCLFESCVLCDKKQWGEAGVGVGVAGGDWLAIIFGE